MRFLFYSHDGVGLGHVRRNLAIAGALTRLVPSANVLITTSVDEVCQLGLPANVDTLKIPGLRKRSNSEYGSRRLAMGASEIHGLRAALLQEAARAFRPDVLLVDKHPLGAGGELQGALETVRSGGGKVVLGLRDILDSPEEVRNEWRDSNLAELVARYYDRVLIYGSPVVFDPIKEYDFPAAVAQRTEYCGYVMNGFDCAWRSNDCPYTLAGEHRSNPVVLGTAGGGEDGYQMIRSFVQAAGAERWDSVAVPGPMVPAADLQSLQHLAAEHRVSMRTFIPCLSNLFRTADALVCMGGYNTLTEAVANGVPAVCIPRTKPRKEQLIRSEAFEALGLVRTLRPENLTPTALRHAVNSVLEVPRRELYDRARHALQFDGAKLAAEKLISLCPGGRPSRKFEVLDIPHRPACLDKKANPMPFDIRNCQSINS
jgi:predicted glycosyltransferase